ncbi:MAG: helix-turn-helix domain-containing protein [Prosthecobacter sp.]|nr:helix-turn-helix domain-containing protein [Prosthecobacter sp.]
MEKNPIEPATASSLTARKITRHELAAYQRISVRHVAELTRNGILPFYKIGRSVRYDLSECEAALRERFHVKPKAKKPASTGTRAPSSAT